MSYITEAGHSDLEDVPTYVWAAALKSVDLSQTTLVINHDALSKVLSYNSEYYHFLQDIQARQVYILARFAINNQQLERASDYKILGYSEHLLDVPVSNLETAPTSTRSPLELRLLKHLFFNNSHAERILPDSRVSNKYTQIVSEDTVQFITGLTKDLQDQISSFFQKVSYDSDSVTTISDLAEAILDYYGDVETGDFENEDILDAESLGEILEGVDVLVIDYNTLTQDGSEVDFDLLYRTLEEGTSQDVSSYPSTPSTSSSQPSTTVKMSRFLSTGVYR